MARIGFLGTGEIATAMVETLAGKGHKIFVSERNVTVSSGLAARFSDVTVAPNDQVVAQSEVVFLCLLAPVAKAVLPELPFRTDHAIVSVMVDLGHDALLELCAPAATASIAIPLPSLPGGQSPLVCYPSSETLHPLLGDSAKIQVAPTETALNAHFAATSLLLPLFTQLRVGADWLAEFTGDKAMAEHYLTALMGSYFQEFAQNPDLRIETVQAGLSVAGGLNDTLNRHLAQEGMLTALRTGLDGFRDRLGLPARALSASDQPNR
ncbi:MAG: NAD(P)-binding domain-containing protein [Pseudorhodobacter sp.]|nr:NAD(P)-binding domain-containing protein [Pseudorhodobacter sp.]